jgi:hypothetical protein
MLTSVRYFNVGSPTSPVGESHQRLASARPDLTLIEPAFEQGEADVSDGASGVHIDLEVSDDDYERL